MDFHPGSGAEWTQTAETAIAHPAIDNIELSTDAKLLITGTFEAFNGMPAPGIASLNLDGSPDPTFVAPIVREKFDIRQAKLQRQSDGSYLLSGPYSVPGQSPAPSFVHLNNATKFRTEALVRHGLNVVVTFDAVAGNTYRLEYKNALTDDTWTRVAGVADLTASKTGLARLTDPGAASVSQRFYRVRLVP
jgi:hypothetical protein